MKYKEEIIESLDTLGPTTVIVDGKELTKKGTISMAFPRFIMSLSAILVSVTSNFLLQDYPAVDDPDEADDNKLETNAILRELIDEDSSSCFDLFQHTHKFLDWLLEEEAPVPDEDAEDWDCWYHIGIINDKWNEFASFHGAEE